MRACITDFLSCSLVSRLNVTDPHTPGPGFGFPAPPDAPYPDPTSVTTAQDGPIFPDEPHRGPDPFPGHGGPYGSRPYGRRPDGKILLPLFAPIFHFLTSSRFHRHVPYISLRRNSSLGVATIRFVALLHSRRISCHPRLLNIRHLLRSSRYESRCISKGARN